MTFEWIMVMVRFKLNHKKYHIKPIGYLPILIFKLIGT